MDEKSKRDRVESIDDEVNALHPLLHSIFKKLTNISYVEYTHGPNEMGADFVLEKFDQDLGSRNYVGVVVKADKILQNFSDVERQIDECITPRLIRQGAENVRLPEVWVITSKTVSQNAKQKIYDKYSSRIIHFFDCDWLVRKIDEHAPYFWEELTTSIGVYLTQLDKRLSVMAGQSTVPAGALVPVQIDLDVQEIESDKYSRQAQRKKPRLVNLVDEILVNKVTFLEAEMGFGKSHLARKIVSHFAETAVYRQHMLVPSFGSFKRFMEGNSDPELYLQTMLGFACYADAVAEGASFLIVLDGIDEAAADFDKCKECVEKLIESVRGHKNIRLLLTSRPIKPFEGNAVISSTAKRYRIRQLSLRKIISYLKQVLESRHLPNRLLEDLGKSELFKQLPQNPIAAALLGNLLAQDRFELPSNLTELYAKTMELMMGRWDEKRQISTEKLYRATERLARHLARYMIDNQLVYMSRQEIKSMFEAFLAERNLGVPLGEAFDYLLNRSNLFGTYPDTEAVFFRHRSFAEYLYARDAYEARNFEINHRAFHPYWINTYFFYIGSLGECPDVLATLINTSPGDEASRFLRILSIGNYLLAGYQTPYSVIQDSLDVVMVEAAKLYIDARDGRAFSSLRGLSEMQTLWLFAMTVRHCYGYQFFEKALPYAMAKIDESLEGDEVKAYALFFAAGALREVDNNCGFEFLLQKRRVQDLPLPLNLALRAELEYSSKEFANSGIVKQYEKSLKKLLFADKASRMARDAHIESLFKEPLSARKQKASTAPLGAIAGK